MKNIIIKPIFRVTIFCLLLLIFSSIIGGSSFQSINVKSFKILENDLDARVNFPKRDQNGEVCAIIKVVTSATGLTFDIGSLGVVATQQTAGEVWVYVPRGAQRITISHQQLGVLRNYAFPESIKSISFWIALFNFEGYSCSFCRRQVMSVQFSLLAAKKEISRQNTLQDTIFRRSIFYSF